MTEIYYIPKGIAFKSFFSISSPSFAVMSDAMNPGAMALTCNKGWFKKDLF